MDFDRHCTSAARLAILSGLVGGQPLSFMDLKKVTGLADGNLYVQCGRLTEAGYLERTQGGETGRTKTFYRITEKGLSALKLHVRKLQIILESGNAFPGRAAPRRRADDSQFW